MFDRNVLVALLALDVVNLGMSGWDGSHNGLEATRVKLGRSEAWVE